MPVPDTEQRSVETIKDKVADPVDVDDKIKRALQADASRRSGVTDIFNKSGLIDDKDGTFLRSLTENPEITIDMARAKIFERMIDKAQPMGNRSFNVEVGTESKEKLRSAITDGLLLRQGVKVEKPAEGSNVFRGRTMIDVCREMLEFSGERTSNMDNQKIASRSIISSSTSDFPILMSDLANKTLLETYAEWKGDWEPFVNKQQANDFKDIHAVSYSGSQDLQELDENDEYKNVSFRESGEKYRVTTKGARTSLTRQMIINDNLGAFLRIPTLFGIAARRSETAAVYDLINSNPIMSDGENLFSEGHRNLAPDGELVTPDSLSEGRLLMRNQKGLAGESVDVTPQFLIAPVSQQTAIEQLIRSSTLPVDGMPTGTYNPWSTLTPIFNPLLDANSEKAWYMFANPTFLPVIQVSWLMGNEAPFIDDMIDFNSDGILYKVRHDFGAGVVDSIGAFKNNGEV